MPEAWSIFTDAYLKKLKRPEFQGFEPDQAYGANMLFRSEETNPWAGRDRANAQYGPQGASGGIKAQIPSMSVTQPPGSPVQNLLPQGWNIPGLPSQQQSGFNQLMGPVVGVGSQWAGKSIYDWLTKDPMKAGVVDATAGIGPYGEAAEGMIDPSKTAGDLAAGFDPATAAMAAVPQLAKMFGLKGTGGDVLGAAGSTGIAAMQGFANPISDIGALYSLYKMFKGFF